VVETQGAEAMSNEIKRCCKRVYAGSFTGHMCALPYKVTRDGHDYCGIHDPEVVKKRRKKSEEKWDRESKARNEAWQREKRAYRALAYLERNFPGWEAADALQSAETPAKAIP